MMVLDWVLLAIVGASALFGVMRGFVGVLASLVAWVLAGWAAFRFGSQLAVMIAADGEPSAAQLLGGYALCFLGVLLVVGVVGWTVRRLVHSIGLSGLDRVLGLALGVARGAFVACGLVLLLGLTTMPGEPEWRTSQVVPVFVPGAQWMRAWLPEWVAAQVDFSGNNPSPGLDLDGLGDRAPLPAPLGA